jgi:DNA polymerase III epsilon subunit-like protein
MTTYANVSEWARAMLDNPRAYIIDTETTGLGKQDEIVQVALIDMQGRTVHESLVRPTIPVPYPVTRIHGITNEMLIDAPSFAQLYVRLSATLAAATLIAYNMEFDWRMLTQSAGKYGLPLWRSVTTHCAMRQYAALRGGRWQKLSAACQQQGIAIGRTHQALDDAHLTLELLRAMAR